MTDQKSLPGQNVLASDWDYLVVLDAARYDVFASVYDEYLEGDLEKRRSVGSATPEWAAKTFTGHHDITYVSGNPFINSLGTPLNELRWGASAGYEWTASDHIAEIDDVWQTGWNEELGAVTPGAVSEAAREHLPADDRLIVHYLQPHAPYIRQGKGRKLERIKAGFEDVRDSNGRHPYLRRIQSIGDRVRRRIEPWLGNSELAMRLGMLLELNPATTLDIVQDGIEESLREYYEQNLRLVLEEVAQFVGELDGEVVVTSDHGEAFGEYGVWEHHVETYIPPLVEVPWLRLENGVAD